MRSLLKVALVLALVAMTGMVAYAAVDVQAADQSEFRKIDTNKDNALALVEYKAFYTQQFNSMDASKDGKASLDELVIRVTKEYMDADVNKDNVITVDEYVFFKTGKASVPKEKVEAAKNAAAGNKGYIYRMDTDQDGVISTEEYGAFFVSLYEDADTNKDQQVTKEELIAQVQKQFAEANPDNDTTLELDEYHAYWVGK